MPSRQTGEGEYKDIAHPLNTPTRDEKYIINGSNTIDKTYEQAVYHT